MSRLPLEGVRIADFTQVVQGPYGTMMMAMMGAEVLKMETASPLPRRLPRFRALRAKQRQQEEHLHRL